MITHLVGIDPQDDFMDIGPGLAGDPADYGGNVAALPVKGALADMTRLAAMVDRVGHRFDDIHITLDSHNVIDVAHPGFWVDARGSNPSPFTMITHGDIKAGLWSPRNPADRRRMLDYTDALARNGQFDLMIWPEHCLIGSWGHNVIGVLRDSLTRWERSTFSNVDFVTKGANPYTEHYGALAAEVPDPADPSTQINGDFIRILQGADIVAIAGQASSHCVKTTVEQIVGLIGDEHLPKLHLLTDCMSPVSQVPGGPPFPAIADQFLRDMQARGLVLTTSVDFLA